MHGITASSVLAEGENSEIKMGNLSPWPRFANRVLHGSDKLAAYRASNQQTIPWAHRQVPTQKQK
jgi:hypothetical protein